MAHVRDRPLADRHVEHRLVLGRQARSADDRAVLGEMGPDLLDLLVGVAERLQRQRHGPVDDRHLTTAHQLLVLDQREVGSTPVVSQSIRNEIVPVGAKTEVWALR